MRYRAITRNREFSRVYARGRSYVHPQLVLYVMKNRLGHTRVGLTATKKVGGAVQRNRARRVMREAAFASLPYDVGGYDFIFVARARTARCKSTQLAPVAAGLLAQAGFGPGGVRVPPQKKAGPKPGPNPAGKAAPKQDQKTGRQAAGPLAAASAAKPAPAHPGREAKP